MNETVRCRHKRSVFSEITKTHHSSHGVFLFIVGFGASQTFKPSCLHPAYSYFYSSLPFSPIQHECRYSKPSTAILLLHQSGFMVYQLRSMQQSRIAPTVNQWKPIMKLWCCQLCRHWRHRRLSLWQPTGPLVKTKLASCPLSIFFDWTNCYSYCRTVYPMIFA